jgi:hypothetical protein
MDYNINMIQKKIDSLHPYFKAFRVTDNYRIVEMTLKSSWYIPESEEISLQQKELKDSPNVKYNIFYSDKNDIDYLLDYIDKNVIKYNLELEEKEDLLRLKVEELKRVFETKSIDELNNLKFTTNNESLKLKTISFDKITDKITDNGVTKELSTNN